MIARRGFRKRGAQKRRFSDVVQSIAEDKDIIRSTEPQGLPNLGLEYEKTVNGAGRMLW